MFKFTIRDLLWLTLVVAVALAWLVRERQLAAQLQQQQQLAASRATVWRQRAGALEHVLTTDFGISMRWTDDSRVVIYSSDVSRYPRGRYYSTTAYEPSIQDD